VSLRLDWTHAIRADADLSSSAKLVAYALATYMDGDGLCWPSVAKLAGATSLSEKTAKRARDELVASSWLVVVEQGGGRTETGEGKSNRYRAAKKGVTVTPLRGPGAPKKGVTVSKEGGHGDPRTRHLTRKGTRRARDGDLSDAAVARSNGRPLDEACFGCGERPVYELVDGRLLCSGCIDQETASTRGQASDEGGDA
jgi:hypothetical protein